MGRPVFAPERLKQTRGGAEPRIGRLVDAMFFENVGRDERQLVNGFTEFRAHASRSNGHEANSGDSRGNLQRAIWRLGLFAKPARSREAQRGSLLAALVANSSGARSSLFRKE